MKISKVLLVTLLIILVLLVIQFGRLSISDRPNESDQEFLTEMEDFKKLLESKISENELVIQELKEKMANNRLEFRVDYQNRVSELEYLNSGLKKKLAAYVLVGEDQWHEFKNELDHDLDEIGNDLKEITIERNN